MAGFCSSQHHLWVEYWTNGMYCNGASTICVWNIRQLSCTCTGMDPASSVCGILDKFQVHVLWWSQNHLCGILNKWHVLWWSQNHPHVEYWTTAMYTYCDGASIICVWNIGQLPCSCTVMEPALSAWGIFDNCHVHVLWWSQHHLRVEYLTTAMFMYCDGSSTICGWNIEPMACTLMEPAPSLGGILNQWHVLWYSQHHPRVEYWTKPMHLYCDEVGTICVWKTGMYMYCDGASTICRWNIEPMACTVMEPAPSACWILNKWQWLWWSQNHLWVEYWTNVMYCDGASTICGIEQMACTCTVMEPAPSVGGILNKWRVHVLWWSQHHLLAEYWTNGNDCDGARTICG